MTSGDTPGRPTRSVPFEGSDPSVPDRVTCDVGDLPCNASVVDAMARVRLRAGRLGIEVRYRDPCDELRALVDLAGLGEVLLDLGLEAGRQAEEREEPSGVEEEGDP